MHSNISLLSAIRRGLWAIEPTTLTELLPTAENMLAGNGLAWLHSEPAHANEARLKSGQPGPAPVSIFAAVSGGSHTFSMGYYTDLDALPAGSICIIPLQGIITKSGFCGGGSMLRAERILEAGAHQNVAGILIDADTPGGQANGLNTVYDAITTVRDTHQKPVLFLVNDGMAASAGVHTLSACSEAWATHSTCRIGSIGALQMLRDSSERDKKNGDRNILVYATKSTQKNAEVREALAGNPTKLVAELDALNEDFHARVSHGRPRLSGPAAALDGAMFGADEALKYGLIDRIGSYNQALDRILELAQASPTGLVSAYAPDDEDREAAAEEMEDAQQDEAADLPPIIRPIIHTPTQTTTPNKTHSMAQLKYAALCAALGYSSLATTAEGAHLNVDALTALDGLLATASSTTTQLATATTELAASATQLATANAELTTAQATIDQLEQRVLQNPAGNTPAKITPASGEADPAPAPALTEWEKLDAQMMLELREQQKLFGIK